ncbi:MAG: hypothetical protein IPJ85_05620 [Flavobacteriales bacterium]|nr:hypothetical protein [Flavobacteriales bacterium]
MKQILSFVAFLTVISVDAQYQRTGHSITFIKDGNRPLDIGYQYELRQGAAWQAFLAQYPEWTVEYNESSGMPRLAFGPPITADGATPEEKAAAFMESELSRFGAPIGELMHVATLPAKRITYIHFKQEHNGLPVLWSKAMVKLDAWGRVIAFELDAVKDIPTDLAPILGPDAAISAAQQGLSGIVAAEAMGKRYLPVPTGRSISHRLVEEVMVHTQGARPGRFHCLVDLVSGELLYREDLVVSEQGHGDHCGHDEGGDDAADAQVNGNVHTNGALVPATVEGLPDLRLTINGSFYYTDDSGYLPTGLTGPVSAQVQLRGRWSNTRTNAVTPSFNSTLNEGANTISFDANANIRQRTAYYGVSRIHNHCKSVLPSFTGMDIVLNTNVDVTGDTCNAYYDGSSINFYAQSATCRALSLYSDVIYHEYGHGINSTFYQSIGQVFNNGAMNEGYADVWAITLTENPVMTLGFRIPEPNSYIRRYDQDPRVYPIDIVGEVHSDGEIIAGAWWDTYRLLNWDMPLTLSLFADAYPGAQATVANGNEGVAFRNVLIAVLQADDDDGNIANGTPHGTAIVQAFALHGITLLSNAQFNHTPVASANPNSTIPINSTLALTFPFNTYVSNADLHYRLTENTPWVTVPLNINGSNYTAQIPGQPAGTIVAYYLTVNDVFGSLSTVTPIGANLFAQGYLPHYTMVGFTLIATEDGDNFSELGNWITSPQGNATTGQWEYGVIIPSYLTPGDPNTIVQAAQQHTPGGLLCYYTGNAASANSAAGTNDIDAGSTILVSDPMNLTGYTNPAFTYWRWYTNSMGANPSADWWQVELSNNNGSTWVRVENTKASDRSWRRKAFRVEEFLPITANMRMRFIASDSLRLGVSLNGGSLVEAALDDIQLWNAPENTLNVDDAPVDLIGGLYPNPTSDLVHVRLTRDGMRNIRFDVADFTGRVVRSQPMSSASQGWVAMDVSALAEGQYILVVSWDGGRSERRFTVMR